MVNKLTESLENNKKCVSNLLLKKNNIMLQRQIDKNEAYFSVICEALDIKHNSRITDILLAIKEIKKNCPKN